jgi:hypothetical protein
MRFVWLDVVGGGRVPVNPDQVRYIKRNRAGRTTVVFGAIPGGWDELELAMDAEEAVAALQGQNPDPAELPTGDEKKPPAGGAGGEGDDAAAEDADAAA